MTLMFHIFKVVLLNQHINFQVEFSFLLLQKWWEGFWCGNSFSSLFELQYNDKKVFIFHFLKILYFVCKRQLGTSPSSWCLSLIEKKWYSCNLICYLILSYLISWLTRHFLSLLDNAPSYLIGRVIQNRISTFFPIRL